MKKITRVQNFKRHGLGMFLHYGLYNFLEKGEWYQEMNKLSSEEYYNLFGDLKNLSLNLKVEEIVKFASENGFKYIVLTTKHHDGFALYDSQKNSDIDITKTNTTDIVKKFVAACKRYQLDAFLYHATLDWSKLEMKTDWDAYINYLHNNIKFLCENYPEIKGFWFDGNWSHKNADWKEEKLYKIIRDRIPEAIIINNSGIENAGKEQHYEVDSITFEQASLYEIDYKKFSRDLAAEACQTFNDHWGYANNDFNYKSLKDLIYKFVGARKINANYLLNMSINKQGELIPLEVETVKLLNDWIQKYGTYLLGEYDVVHSTPKDFLVRKNDNYYLFLYDITSGGHVKKIQEGGLFQETRSYNLLETLNIKKGNYLDNQKEVKFKQKNNQLIVDVNAFDYGVNTIIRVIEFKGE